MQNPTLYTQISVNQKQQCNLVSNPKEAITPFTVIKLAIMRNALVLLMVGCVFVFAPSNLHAQKKLHKYDYVTLFQRICGDTVIISSPVFPEFEVHQPIYIDETRQFEIDSSYREIVAISGKSYMIDSLLYNNYSEYNGTYHFELVYVIEGKNKRFFIVSFYNAYQMGTMVQPCYLVFRQRDGETCLSSVYMLTDIEDNSGRIENTVRVHLKNDDLYLSGKNLELLKSLK